MGQKVIYTRLDEDFMEDVDNDPELTQEELDELAAWEEPVEAGSL